MEERDILKSAAKAAGYDVIFNDSGYFSKANGGGLHILGPHWNPLENDGDAFRLAVDLKIEIYYEGSNVSVRKAVLSREKNDERRGKDGVDMSIDATGGCYAATRRAIVLVAAAIAVVHSRKTFNLR